VFMIIPGRKYSWSALLEGEAVTISGEDSRFGDTLPSRELGVKLIDVTLTYLYW